MSDAPIEVAATRDRELVRSLISGDRWITAHALCDLDDGEFPRTRCYVARRGGEAIALGMEYSGWAPQPLHLYGEPAGVAAIRAVARAATTAATLPGAAASAALTSSRSASECGAALRSAAAAACIRAARAGAAD